MKPTLQTRLSQQLTLTPQLQQAIRLLQLSAYELAQEIQENLANNPLLELCDEADQPAAPATVNANNVAETSHLESATTTAETDNVFSLADGSRDWQDTAYSSTTPDEWPAALELKDNRDSSLHSHLSWQMSLTPFSETDQAIATAIIDAIDDDGYLSCSLADIKTSIGRISDEDIDDDEILAVLHRIQQFDPVGVASRNLMEYLIFQLNQHPKDAPGLQNAMIIVNKHIELLGKRDYKRIQQLCHLQDPEFQQSIQLIKSLSPRPSYHFSHIEPQYIVPDVIVTKQQGHWVVELNHDTTPGIQINPHYAKLASEIQQKSDAHQLKEHLQQAKWFLKSLQSRNETLLKVATCIVTHQQAFLSQGDVAMRPLILQDVATATELHESTISRITTQKFIQTPVGIYELKYFFTSHVNTSDGQQCSSTAIRALIKQLISQEDPVKPLSDNKIAELLAQQNSINIARRTITKYREAMGISPSNERKQLERLPG